MKTMLKYSLNIFAGLFILFFISGISLNISHCLIQNNFDITINQTAVHPEKECCSHDLVQKNITLTYSTKHNKCCSDNSLYLLIPGIIRENTPIGIYALSVLNPQNLFFITANHSVKGEFTRNPPGKTISSIFIAQHNIRL